MIATSHSLIEKFVLSRIIYNILDEEPWIQYLNTDDPTVLKALDILKKGKATPTLNDI